MTQKMGALPDFRVNAASPFEKTALDLAGPFLVKMNGRANHKVWITIFTCCVTRAVHAEIVYKMDADALINADSPLGALACHHFFQTEGQI